MKRFSWLPFRFSQLEARRAIGSLLLIPCILSTSTGCGGGNVAPVSGVLIMDGKPLEGASVNFAPIAPKGQMNNARSGSYAKTDENGRFVLKMVDNDQRGALVGKHKVSFSIAIRDEEDDSGATTDDKVPAWASTESVYTFTVPSGGTDKADFEISSEEPPPEWKDRKR